MQVTTHADMQLFGSATMATQGQVPHSNCELRSIQRDPIVWVVKLGVHARHLLETSVTCSQPCHTVIWLTLTAQLIWK